MWIRDAGLASRARLATLDYDFERLRRVMRDHDVTTVQLIHREAAGVYSARNPFPVGGVVEDPATGAAAAAFGGYLRDRGLVTPPTTITIRQGYDMGCPSHLSVTIPASGGIRVTGTAGGHRARAGRCTSARTTHRMSSAARRWVTAVDVSAGRPVGSARRWTSWPVARQLSSIRCTTGPEARPPQRRSDGPSQSTLS